jgi:DNA-binding SARP family transcriptional activator
VEDSAEFEQWALVQRESLHQHVLEAYSYLANYYELHGDFQAAQRHALRQLELDPWREEAHCQVMRALALDGQRSAALAHYEHCRRVLAEEWALAMPRRAICKSRFGRRAQDGG